MSFLRNTANGTFRITPDSTSDLAERANAVHVGGAGDLDYTDSTGVRLVQPVQVGVFPVKIIKVWETTTTATSLLGLTY